MRKRIVCLALTIAFILISAFPSFAVVDSKAPVLHSVSISGRVLQYPNYLLLTLNVSDDVSGV